MTSCTGISFFILLLTNISVSHTIRIPLLKLIDEYCIFQHTLIRSALWLGMTAPINQDQTVGRTRVGCTVSYIRPESDRVPARSAVLPNRGPRIEYIALSQKFYIDIFLNSSMAFHVYHFTNMDTIINFMRVFKVTKATHIMGKFQYVQIITTRNDTYTRSRARNVRDVIPFSICQTWQNSLSSDLCLGAV